MRRADFSVQVDRRRAPCVLDPALVLAHAPGPALALRLAAVLEPWLTRSFWQALDASELLLMHGAAERGEVNDTALCRWLALREGTDSGSWVLRWVGDRLAESHLLDAADGDVVERYEQLLQGLQQRALRGVKAPAPTPREAVLPEPVPAPAAWHGFDPAECALDGLALSATLEGALLLCALPGQGRPHPVAAAERLGLHVVAPGALPADSLFMAERQFLREALARAGLAPLAQALPALAAVHVWLDEPEPATLARLPGAGLADMPADPWQHARVWWYPL